MRLDNVKSAEDQSPKHYFIILPISAADATTSEGVAVKLFVFQDLADLSDREGTRRVVVEMYNFRTAYLVLLWRYVQDSVNILWISVHVDLHRHVVWK